MMNKKALYAAVAASFGAGLVANAAAAPFANEINAGTAITVGTKSFQLTSLYAPTGANPMYLQIALTNGATWSTALASADLTCTAVGGLTGTTAAMVSLAAGGAANTAVATFVITASISNRQLSACQLTTLTASPGANGLTIAMNTTITYGNALAVTGTVATQLVSGQSLITASVSAASDTVSVDSGYINFSGGTTGTFGTVTLTFTDLTQTAGGAIASATPNTLDEYVSAYSITVASDALVNAASAYLSTGTTCAAVAAGTSRMTAGTASITFSAVAQTVSTAYYTLCLPVTGQVVPEGTITVSVAAGDKLAAMSGFGTELATSTIGTITHDGASTTLLNVPPSTNSDSGFVRIYNTSSQTGNVMVTVRGEDGVALGTSNCVLGSLAGGAVMVKSASAIETACAITPPAAGRYRISVNGAFTTVRAQGLARTGGVLVNLSADTSSRSVD